MRGSFVRVTFAALIGIGAVAAGTFGAADNGRYKKQGNRCVWDATDSGPNQCTPVAVGRFKEQGGTCLWVAKETGADQCKPAKGRFKKEGTACVWNATDSGPNQCDPRRAK